jgi:chromosome segregation ATPase
MTEHILLPDDDATMARKRRRDILRGSSQTSVEMEQSGKRPKIEESYSDNDDDDESCATSLKKPSIRGIKRQARYEPGVPMTREQLAAWRKEARRVRNRESAAASRKKTRERIDQLEDELAELQRKYEVALKRIVVLEGQGQDQGAPEMISQDLSLRRQVVSPPNTPPSVRSTFEPSSPPTFSLNDGLMGQDVDQHNKMISRPTAV